MKYDVFISYSRRDLYDESGKEIPGCSVGHIIKSLSENHIEFWIDRKKIKSGNSFGEKISQAISDSDVFLYISSQNSNSSKWAIKEVACAEDFNKYIIPIKIDSSPYGNKINYYLSDIDYIDYVKDPDDAIKRLIEAITHNSVEPYIPNRIKFEKKGLDVMLGEILISQRLISLFSARNISEAIIIYDNIVSEIKKEIDSIHTCVIEANKRLDLLKGYTNRDLQREHLCVYTTSIYEKIEEQNGLDKLLLQLSLLMCVVYLNEPVLANKIRQEIKDTEISQSFWDAYGGLVKGAGTAIAYFAAFLMGSTPATVGYGIKVGADANETHKMEIKKYKMYYTSLRDMISSISFVNNN